MLAAPCVSTPRFTRMLLDFPASGPPLWTSSSSDRVSASRIVMLPKRHSMAPFSSLLLPWQTGADTHQGPAENTPFFTNRRAVFDLGDLSQPEVYVRTLKLTQQIGTHELTIYASEFLPQPGDVVSYKWRDGAGDTKELEMPHFCLTNIEKVRINFKNYISSAKELYLKALESEDELAWMTVRAAQQYAKTKPVSTLSLP